MIVINLSPSIVLPERPRARSRYYLLAVNRFSKDMIHHASGRCYNSTCSKTDCAIVSTTSSYVVVVD